jgi:heme-degrading monooxygenase HmoA
MFVRIVTMPLKPGVAEKYAEAVEHYAIPVLRKQKGFVEQLGLVTADGKTSIGITLWESERDAEAYARASFADVMKALGEVAAGPFDVKVGEVTNSTAHKASPVLVAEFHA